MKLRVNYHVLIWTIIIYFFAFQRAFIEVSEVFSYFDEIFAILVIISIVMRCVRKSSMTRNEQLILVLLGLVCLVGIIGNLTSGIMKKPFPIFVDILSTVKVLISYYAIATTNWKSYVYDELIKTMAKVGRAIVFIMAFFLLASQFFSLGMTGGVRYGVKCFQFVLNNPGNFSKFFYFLSPLLVADLYYKSTRYKKFVILIALIVWASTMRSRAISFIAVFLILGFFYFSVKGKACGALIKSKIKIRYLIPVVLIAAALSWKQIVFYFTSDTQARAVLLRYGIITMISYFPIGAGFGTFGSDIAAKYYSRLYTDYGFEFIYGMRSNETYFLNDNYWPMVMGQFGVIGLLIFIVILYLFIKMAVNGTKNNKYFYFSTFIAMIFLLLSSTASNSYSEFSSICVFLLVGILVKSSRKQETQGATKNV